MKANKKRKLPVAIAAGAMALSLAAGSVSAFASPTKGGFIGEAKAKQIALKNAGLKESEVSFVRIGLGFDDGRYEYDVEFYKGNVEYDYEIDAKTGKIVEFDKDIEDFVIPGSNVASITVDKAKEIALKHAGLKASQVSFVKAELDEDNGKPVFDIEFYKGKVEYDYEIDAKTGKVLEFDFDIDGFVIPGNNMASITVDKAKEIALKHVGLKASQVKFVKAELGEDDGLLVYDIEFYAGNVEYDFEIDAKSGKIVEFDKDIEDFVIPNDNVAKISLAEAKKIALDYVWLKEPLVSFVKAELTQKDGKLVYDIEFYRASMEYDFEIDAKTGKILSFDYDIDAYPAPPSNTTITLAQAKKIALDHVWLKEPLVSFVKAELTQKDGKLVYDIEFYRASMEYDFEIDAKTGKILSFDYDIDAYPAPPSNTMITLDKAKEIALNYVGLNASQVNFTKAKLDVDDGVQVYDIEFYKGNREYDFEIDAKTGKILEFDYDIEGFVIPDNNATISLDKAKEIALNYVGLNASQVNFTKAKLEKDDGMQIYDIEFYAGNREYDFEIDAKTGRILEFDYDIEGFVIPDNNATISLDKAKEIALNYVGLSASQVHFVKAKLDKDDGYLVYDIEFYSGNVEYDFEIDAKTGRILEFDKDIEKFVIPGNESSSINLEKAKQIALNYVGLSASQVTFTKAKLDKDDGRLTYDIKFYAGNTEYDFEIDAQTGRILDFDYEVNDDWDDDWDDWDDDDWDDDWDD